MKIITISLEEEFPTMRELVAYVAKKLRQELRKLPKFPAVNAFQEVQLLKATKYVISYKVRFGQVSMPVEEEAVNGVD